MGDDVVSTYLRRKLGSYLEEVEADPGSPSSIISHFRSVEVQIEKVVPIPVDLLYEVIEALSECRVFSYERRTAAVSKKDFFYFLPSLIKVLHPLAELMFKRRMRKRVKAIEKKLESLSPADGGPPPPGLVVIHQTKPIRDQSDIIEPEQAGQIEAWLMPSSEEGYTFRAIGIVGRCGCGKTALAQKVFASPIIEQDFMRMETRLSDEIYWKIFSKVVHLQGEMDPTDPRLCTIQNDVKINSQGLALAARTLATILPKFIKRSYYWIRARDLEITWGDDKRYWRWTNLPPPEEMEEVAELVEVCWLSIKGTLERDNFLFEQSYSAYLVFKLKADRKYLDIAMTARVSIVSRGKKVIREEERSVFIDRNGEGGPLPQAGGTGWMEIKLGEFFIDKGTWVEALLIENKDQYWKPGLIVKGIKFRLN